MHAIERTQCHTKADAHDKMGFQYSIHWLVPYARIQRGGQGVRTTPLKNHKNIEFLSNTGPDPLKFSKSQSYQASIQRWAIIGPPANQRNAIQMAFRWRADDGPLLLIFGPSLPLKKNEKKPVRVAELEPLWQIFLDPRMGPHRKQLLTRTLWFEILKNQAKTKDLHASAMQSLSLSLSFSLSHFTTCYQSLWTCSIEKMLRDIIHHNMWQRLRRVCANVHSLLIVTHIKLGVDQVSSITALCWMDEFYVSWLKPQRGKRPFCI